VRIVKIFLILLFLSSVSYAGLFEVLKNIFSSSEPKEKKISIPNPNIPPSDEILIDSEEMQTQESEEYLLKIEPEKYPPVYKISFILPKKIGKYRETTVNAVIAYLIRREKSFDVKTYTLYENDFYKVESLLTKIENSDTDLIVAPVTKNIADRICSLYVKKIIYIPTISGRFMECSNPNVYFGGIDYLNQFKKLAEFASSHSAVIVKDSSPLSKELSEYSSFYFLPKASLFVKDVKAVKTNVLKNKNILKKSNIILNIPIVKSSLFLSTLYFYSIFPKAVFSTQINYDPKIFTLTQYKMRKNFYIANSIGSTYVKYYDAAKLLDSDVIFDRVNYATINGTDYFFVKSFLDRGRIFKEKMENNSLVYRTKITIPKKGEFVTISK